MSEVPVVNHDNVALAPCSPARARTLLAKGRAEVINRNPFTIRLKPATEKIAEKTMEKEATEKSQLSTPFLKHISGKWATITQSDESEAVSSHRDWTLGYAQRVKEAAKSSEFSESHRSVLKGVLKEAVTAAEATKILRKFDELHPRYKTLSILTSGLFSAADAGWELTPEQKEMREKLKNKWAPTGLLNGVTNENERFVLAADFEVATNIIMVALDLVQESIDHPNTIDETASLVLDEMAMNTLYAIRKIYDLGFKIPEENPPCETSADVCEGATSPVDASTAEPQVETPQKAETAPWNVKTIPAVCAEFLPKTGTYFEVVREYLATVPDTRPHTCSVARLTWAFGAEITNTDPVEAAKTYESYPAAALGEKDWFVIEAQPALGINSQLLAYDKSISWYAVMVANTLYEMAGRDLSVIKSATQAWAATFWSLSHEYTQEVIKVLFLIIVRKSMFIDPDASTIRFFCEESRLDVNCCDGLPVLDAIAHGIYSPKFIYSMLDLGFDIHSHNDWLLAHAVEKGWLDVTKELIRRGAIANKNQPIFLNDPNVCRTLALATLSE